LAGLAISGATTAASSERTVLGVAKALIGRLEPGDEPDKWLEYVEDRPFNDKRYYISNAKLKALGWTQTIAFESGVSNVLSLR
jgi:dTDP-D-glucose 4,6-dehydratase